MNNFINHFNLFKKARLFAALFVVLFLPQGLWAEEPMTKPYTFNGSEKILNPTTQAYDMHFYHTTWKNEKVTTWILSGASSGSDLTFGVDYSADAFIGATLTSIDEFYKVSKIVFDIDLEDKAIEYGGGVRWVRFRCGQTSQTVDATLLDLDPDEHGVVLKMDEFPAYGPLSIQIEGEGYEITLNSITVEYKTQSRFLNKLEFDGTSPYVINWSERNTVQIPDLGYYDDDQFNYMFIRLSNSELSKITYWSEKENIATISNEEGDKGHITIHRSGSTTIHAVYPGDTRYKEEDAQYILTVIDNSEQYDLWIGGIQVSEGNCSDILDDAMVGQGVPASFQYVPSLNKLFITNNRDERTIKTSNNEGLTVYLAPNSNNKISDIIYTSQESAPLTITTDGNNPGKIILSANDYVIRGFSSLTLEQNLVITDPADLAYDTNNRRLETTHATISVPLSPITKEKNITPNGYELQPEDGSDNINKVVDDILYTLGNVNSSDGDGYDDGGFIVINSVTTNSQAADAIQNYTPGTEEYLERFKGLTFMIPAGKGNITFNMQTLSSYVMKVKVGDAAPCTVRKARQGKVTIPYNVAEPTYVYVWNAGRTRILNNARSIHKGKMTTVHIKITGVGVKPNQVKSSNSAAEASGGQYNGGNDINYLEGQEPETDDEIEASKGDVNGDEAFNVADIVGIANAINGEHSTTYDKRAADVDSNSVIDAEDIVRLIEKMIGQ